MYQLAMWQKSNRGLIVPAPLGRACALDMLVILCILSFFVVLRRYVENGWGASKWVGGGDRNAESHCCGLMQLCVYLKGYLLRLLLKVDTY